MNFEELPDNWMSLPLSDEAHIANVLDLFVSLQARFDGAMVLVLCNRDRVPLQPIQIDEMPAYPPPEVTDFLVGLASMLADLHAGAGVLVALARSRHPHVTPEDLAWGETLADAFAGRVEFLGLHVVTMDRCVQVQGFEVAA